MSLFVSVAVSHLFLAAAVGADTNDRSVLFEKALLASCTRHFHRSAVPDRSFCRCFSKAFVTADNIKAVDATSGIMNDDVRDRLKAVSNICLEGKDAKTRSAAIDWIENEK